MEVVAQDGSVSVLVHPLLLGIRGWVQVHSVMIGYDVKKLVLMIL